MLLVLVDVLRPERRWSGVLVGIAAGVKLTPLVFVVLLVVVGQRAAAGPRRGSVRDHGRRRAGRLPRRGVVLDGRAARPRPRRSTGPGPQPVGVRRVDPGARPNHRRRPSGWRSPSRSRQASWSWRGGGGAAAIVRSRPASARWRCCSPRRCRGRTTGSGPCRRRWHCGSAAGSRHCSGRRCSSLGRCCGCRGRRAGSTTGAGGSTSSGNAYVLAALGVVAWLAVRGRSGAPSSRGRRSSSSCSRRARRR